MDKERNKKSPGKLTKRIIDSIQPMRRRKVWIADSEVKGLLLLVHPSGVKSFAVRYTGPSGRRLITLGTYGVVTAEEARKLARIRLGEVASGEDPATEARMIKENPTFGEWYGVYIERAKGRKRTWRRDVQYLALALKLFGSKKLADITAQDCDVFFNSTRHERGDVSANRALASLKACLQDAWRLGHIQANPALRIKMTREPPPRTRVFDENEWGRLLSAIPKLSDPYQKAGVILLVSTGCRLSEALRLRWEDLDMETRTMRLPSPKSGKPQAIPLPAAVIGFLKTLHRKGDYVVAGRYSDKPRFDLKRAWTTVCKEAEVRGNIHDVRRTVGTQLAQRFGVEVAQHILRHSTPSITWRHYVVGQDQEMRRALETNSKERGLGKVLSFSREQ